MSITRRDLLKGGLATTLGLFANVTLANNQNPKLLIKPEKLKTIDRDINLEKLWQDIQRRKKDIFQKWKPEILPEKLRDEVLAMEFACLLENQQTYVGGDYPSPQENDILMSIIKNMRWTYLVSLQSMLAPVQYCFYRDPKTAELKANDGIAGTRKSRVALSLEAAQDLLSIHGIDAEKELRRFVAEELQREIQREIVHDIIENCDHEIVNCLDVRKSINFKLDKINKNLNPKIGFDKWAIVSNEVWEKIWNVCSSVRHIKPSFNRFFWCGYIRDTYATVADAPDMYRHSSAMTAHAFANGRPEFRRNGHIKIILDPLLPKNTAVLGCNKDLFTGYVYMPYIALTQTPAILDPDNFVPRIGFLVRYAKQLVNPNYFNVVTYEI